MPTARRTLAERFGDVIGTVPELPTDMAATARPLLARSAQAMNPLFADSFYYFAIFNPKDMAHAEGETVRRQARRSDCDHRLGTDGVGGRAGCHALPL